MNDYWPCKGQRFDLSGIRGGGALWRSWTEAHRSCQDSLKKADTITTFSPFPFHPMSSVFLKILRIVHLARRYIERTSSRWAPFLAILRRKLSEWWHRCRWPGKPRPSIPAESSFPSNGAGLCSSALGGPTVLREYGVAASNVPASASQGSLRIHVGAERQPATAPPSPIPQAAATLSVEPSYSPNPGPSLLPVDAANFSSRSSSNVSIASTQSRGRGISPVDGPQSPADMPSLPSNTQEPQHTPMTRQKQKMMSLDVHFQSPSLESLPIPAHWQQLPMTISPIQSSIRVASSVADHYEIASQRPSFVASEYYLPEGRYLVLVHSEQIPRYAKVITMQVDCAITFIRSLYVC
jgi:hypothetical protein